MSSRFGEMVFVVAALMLLLRGSGEDEADPPSSAPDILGSVQGRIVVALEGVRFEKLGPVVAFLDGGEARLERAPAREAPKIHQRNAVFAPEFLVISAGETVEMPNDDTIFHNVFSYSRPNAFDLGLYQRGESRSVTFQHPGVVRIYCSIHALMNATIFVAPSPHHARVNASGSFEIRNVPPGRYRVRTWNERLPEASTDVEVSAGKPARAMLTLAERSPDSKCSSRARGGDSDGELPGGPRKQRL